MLVLGYIKQSNPTLLQPVMCILWFCFIFGSALIFESQQRRVSLTVDCFSVITLAAKLVALEL